jgi:hypothetical protein
MSQLPSPSQFGDYGEWPGRDVLDSGGERLGGVREIYLDRETGRPEWVLVDVDGGEARFVPLAGAAVESSAIRVAHSASTIRGAPGIGTEPRIDQSEERRLYDHYGIAYSTEESASGLPAEDPTNLAPPLPAEPPSPVELEKAEIPEPPAMTDRAEALSPQASDPEPVSLSPAAAGPSADPDTLTVPEAPEPVEPESELLSPSASGPGPEVFTPPAPEPPSPPRPPIPPRAPGPQPGGPPAAVKSRKAGLAVGISIAAVLFFIIRRLR